MKKYFMLWMGIAALFLSACSRDDKKGNPQSYVEVMGDAEKEVEPDIFYLSITLSEPNSTKQNDINALEQKMLVAMKSLNIDAKVNLTVTGMSGYNYYWWRKSRTVYQNKSYLLKLNSIGLINKMCDKLDTIGNNNYYLSKVDYSKMDELKKQTQQEAVKKARIKAENLLSGENQKVNELIYLQEHEVYNYNPSPYYDMVVAENKQAYQSEASPVDFNKLKVSYKIVARFSIK